MAKTFAEQRADLENTIAAKKARMDEIMRKAAEDGRSTDEAEGEEFDTIADEVKGLNKDLERVKAVESLNKEKAAPVDGSNTEKAQGSRNHAVPVNGEKLEKGMEFARYAMCLAAARGDTEKAFRIAQNRYPQTERVVKALKAQAETGQSFETVLKANVEAGTTTDTVWAAPLVDYTNFTGDFIEFLRPQTILGQFGTGNVPSLRRVPFNIRIPGQTTGGNAYWVGEGAPKPLTSFEFNATELRWAKVATIAVITEELARMSTPSAEGLVRQALADAVIARLDTDFVDPAKAAVANVSPASITNGVTPVASSGTDADALRADLRALWATYIANNIRATSAVYIMSATTALAISMMQNPLGQPEFPGLGVNGGTLNGVPVIVSEYVAGDTSGGLIILVNASDVFLADDGQVVIDASREASLQMLDNPTNNSATATATAMVSMFQTNSIAIRAERWINWAKRRPQAVAYLTGANYGAA